MWRGPLGFRLGDRVRIADGGGWLISRIQVDIGVRTRSPTLFTLTHSTETFGGAPVIRTARKDEIDFDGALIEIGRDGEVVFFS